MNDWNDEPQNGPGPGGILVVMGVALGAAAAYLLASKQGQQVCAQIADRAGEWKAQAADAIAQGREKVIASVEEKSPPPPDSGSPVREKPL